VAPALRLLVVTLKAPAAGNNLSNAAGCAPDRVGGRTPQLGRQRRRRRQRPSRHDSEHDPRPRPAGSSAALLRAGQGWRPARSHARPVMDGSAH